MLEWCAAGVTGWCGWAAAGGGGAVRAGAAGAVSRPSRGSRGYRQHRCRGAGSAMWKLSRKFRLWRKERAALVDRSFRGSRMFRANGTGGTGVPCGTAHGAFSRRPSRIPPPELRARAPGPGPRAARRAPGPGRRAGMPRPAVSLLQTLTFFPAQRPYLRARQHATMQAIMTHIVRLALRRSQHVRGRGQRRQVPDEAPVEIRYSRSKQQEHSDREQWPWLPGTIVEQCRPDEWYVWVEVREFAVLRDGPRLGGREPGAGPAAVPGFLVPAGYGPSALSASAGRWQP